MSFRYTRHQLLILLALLVVFGSGLAIDRWRRAHPDVVAQIERFDREQGPEPPAGARDAGARVAKPAAQSGAGPIDLNRATAEELARLPGVGPALAARIVEARDAHPFASVEDLRRVRGMGLSKLERVRALATVSPP